MTLDELIETLEKLKKEYAKDLEDRGSNSATALYRAGDTPVKVCLDSSTFEEVSDATRETLVIDRQGHTRPVILLSV